MTIQGNTVTRDIKIDSKFIYCDDDATPSAIMLENDEYLLVRNLQGDVVAVVNAANGETVVEFSYDPWGNVTRKYSETYTDGATEEELNLLDLVMSALCPVTYRGYNYDFTTGLYYLQSRYYNPEWGRFLNTDDTAIMLAKTDDAFSANMYLYCNNNPVNKVDYSGRYKSNMEWIKNAISSLVALMVTYVTLDNKQAILPVDYNPITKKVEKLQLINNECKFSYISKGVNGNGYVEANLVFDGKWRGKVYFNLYIDYKPNYEWEFYLENSFLNYAKIGINEGQINFGNMTSGLGPTGTDIDFIGDVAQAVDIGFSLASKLLDKIPEDKYRSFVRKEMNYQKTHFDLDSHTAVLLRYENYEIKHALGKNRVTNYESFGGCESVNKYTY